MSSREESAHQDEIECEKEREYIAKSPLPHPGSRANPSVTPRLRQVGGRQQVASALSVRSNFGRAQFTTISRFALREMASAPAAAMARERAAGLHLAQSIGQP
eukprot:scaffold328087_cov52-Tisochrysis_lutea.AAC.3